jgi:hypothetical protein
MGQVGGDLGVITSSRDQNTRYETRRQLDNALAKSPVRSKIVWGIFRKEEWSIFG